MKQQTCQCVRLSVCVTHNTTQNGKLCGTIHEIDANTEKDQKNVAK